MKRAITLVLALLFLFTATASAEYISGEGWWDDGYSGTWNYIPAAGLCVKLPYDWCENLLEEDGQYLYMRDDYSIILSVEFYAESLFDLEDILESSGLWLDDLHYEESANLILKDDRDWYVMANDYMFIAFTDSSYGGTAAFSFNYSNEVGDELWYIRRIISSIEAY